MIEEKKKSKAFPIFVLLLGIIFIGLGVTCQMGYLDPVLETIGLKEKDKKDAPVKVEDNSTIEEGNLDINGEQVQSLYKKVNNTKATDYLDYYFRQDNLLVENMDNKFKLLLAFYSIPNSSTLTTISDSEMKEAYTDIFGDIAYKGENFSPDCKEYIYDEKALTYTAKEVNCRFTTGCNTKKEEILKAYQYPDRIEITTIVAFMNTCELKYYKDYKYSDLALEGKGYEKDTLKNNEDKFDHYTYTFTLTNNKYVFSGVKKEA